MNYYRNPTANAAIGAVDREIRLARQLANRLSRLKDQGRLTPEAVEAAWRECPPAFRRFLRQVLER